MPMKFTFFPQSLGSLMLFVGRSIIYILGAKIIYFCLSDKEMRKIIV